MSSVRRVQFGDHGRRGGSDSDSASRVVTNVLRLYL